MSHPAVSEVFERALEEILARVSAYGERDVSPRDKAALRIAVAYSGGLDSSVLLRLAKDYATTQGLQLLAFHVHHGLSPNADNWLRHCESECRGHGVAFDSRRVDLGDGARGNVEESARIRRYAALGELCRLHDIDLLLTAHHRDDQAETVLLQLLRGSGMSGISGMEELNLAPGLLGDDRTTIGRPLLAVSRAELENFAAAGGIRHVDDESNSDSRYARNALRNHVMPALAQYFPGFQQRIVRAASHARSADLLLRTLAEQDLAACREGDCLRLSALGELSAERINNLLRYWFRLHGVRMPSLAWMDELRGQAMNAGSDAQMRVIHPDIEIRRYRGLLHLVPKRGRSATSDDRVAFRWNGEASLHFPAFEGSLHFSPASPGLSAAWLRSSELVMRWRKPGDSLKLARNRPTRDLKHHYQALNIPVWQRERLPQICVDEKLVFSAGIGLDSRFFSESEEEKFTLAWQPDFSFRVSSSDL